MSDKVTCIATLLSRIAAKPRIKWWKVERSQTSKSPTFYLLWWFAGFSGKRNTLCLLEWVIKWLCTFPATKSHLYRRRTG